MLRAIVAALILAALLPVAAAPPAAHGRPKAIFNGRDLTGWEGDPRLWSVQDGAITGITTPENRIEQNSFLLWKGGTLKDFDLRLKFRLRNHNSGVQYRSKDLGEWRVGGYQADIAEETYTGILYEERGRGILAQVGEKVVIGSDGKPRKTGTVGDAERIKAAIRKGEWNEYRITARGNRLIQAINGKVTIEAVDEDPDHRAMEGILALQLHAGPPMMVQFKEIRLQTFAR